MVHLGEIVPFYALFLIELATRGIEIAGITPSPNDAWLTQIGRNLPDSVDRFLTDNQPLIIDRDLKYAAAFRSLPARAGVEPVRLPPRSLNRNNAVDQLICPLVPEPCDRRATGRTPRSSV